MSTLFNNDKFASLSFPLRNMGEIYTLDPTTLFDNGKDFFGVGLHRSQRGWIKPRADASTLDIGTLKILATKTTPCTSVEEGRGFSTLSMPRYGDSHRYRDGNILQEIEPGDAHLSPRTGGIADVGCFSGIILQIDHSRLHRVIRVLGGDKDLIDLTQPYVLRGENHANQETGANLLWSCVSMIDQVAGENSYIAAGLSLDDQVYRCLAIALLKASKHSETAKRRWCSTQKNWTDRVDDLVDYICTNAHLNLTLTDLEEQCNYSARHLQNLFREKFNCTPMQFVRRQRLTLAMERLQGAGAGDTVTRIARDCGYRFTSNFSTDFHREFGVTPSTVLRGSGSLQKKV